jgi:hypothetical protein
MPDDLKTRAKKYIAANAVAWTDRMSPDDSGQMRFKRDEDFVIVCKALMDQFATEQVPPNEAEVVFKELMAYRPMGMAEDKYQFVFIPTTPSTDTKQ